MVRPWSFGQVDEVERAPQAVWTARAEARNRECAGHVEGTRPAGHVGDDAEGQAGFRLRRETHMSSRKVWSFVQLAEKR